jgi:hypothetical protein
VSIVESYKRNDTRKSNDDVGNSHDTIWIGDKKRACEAPTEGAEKK